MSATTANPSTRNKHSESHKCNSNKTNQSYGAPSIDITKEEFARISDALKKEEFRKLFLDYCEEIQDPVNRQRYEDEIKQFEAERGVDVKFINPEPGFVIKTSVDGARKCFINVAKSAEVAKPTSEACYNASSGTRGLNWSIPMAQSAPRDDVDAHGKRCLVYDVVFHPDALYLAHKNEAFHKCLIDTALDAVEREFKVNLDRNNLKFPKMQFKGVARPTVIRKLAKDAPAEAAEPHPLESIYPARPSANAAQPKVIPVKCATTDATSDKPEFTTPKYSIKHRRDVDLAEYTNELDAKLNVTVPRTIIVEIELPLLNSTAECQLDVTSKSLYLLSEKAGAKYKLQLELPYTVDDKKGSARFTADTRQLCITLPVVRTNDAAQQQRSMHDVLLHLSREDSGVESDIRDEINSTGSETPPEEAEEEKEKHEEEKLHNAEETAEPQSDSQKLLTPAKFLKPTLHYQFPSRFDCNVLDNVMSLVLHVRNVQPDSLLWQQTTQSTHLQFTSIGAGYYPTYYAFYLQLPPSAEQFQIKRVDAEAWENNVVLNVQLAATSEHLHSYMAGLDRQDLKPYTVQGKFQVLHGSRQRKKSPPAAVTTLCAYAEALDISVERSECEQAIEIEIKPRAEQTSSTCAANTTTEDDEGSSQMQQSRKGINKKQQRKKNKKRRSLSETAYDDIKAYQQLEELELQQLQQKPPHPPSVKPQNISPQKPSASVAVPAVGATAHVAQQQRKQRSYSECRDSVMGNSSSVGRGSATAVGGSAGSSYKGILKHYSRYATARPSISDSCSSIDDCGSYSSSYSVSADAGVTSAMRFSQSFSDIPEENGQTDALSESCKKTVRFNEVIMKQVFRLDSSILGQRKKNQKRRVQKQRALQRRLSEGDSADYEDMKPVLEENDTNATAAQYFKQKGQNNQKNRKPTHHDSGLELSSNGKDDFNDDNKRKSAYKPTSPRRAHLESESSSDIDGNKNSMMFEIDM